jgi:hypothetical protein
VGIPLQITFDAHDPERQVAFWAVALDYEPEPPPEGFATWRAWYVSVGIAEEELGDGDCGDRLRDPEGKGPKIWFQPVPEAKTVKNRLHLDVMVAGRGTPFEERSTKVLAKVEQLESAGATRLYELSGTGEHFAVVLQDPEGNEFCVA